MSSLNPSKLERAVDFYACLMFVIMTGLLAGLAFVGAGAVFFLAQGVDKLVGFVPMLMGCLALAPFFMWLGAMVEGYKAWKRP